MKTNCFHSSRCLAWAALILLTQFSRASDVPPSAPVVSIKATGPQTGEPGPTADTIAGEFTILRESNTGEPLTLFLRFAGTAAPGTDYEELPQSHTMPAGESRLTLLIHPIGDTLVEGDESVIAALTEPPTGSMPNYHIDPAQREASVVIHDNTPPNARPVVSMELVDPHAAETLIDQNAIFWAEFRVRRTGDLATELVTYLNTQQGSAKFGQDYRLDHVDNGSMVRFAAGVASVNVRLYPIDDAIYEGDESVFFHLIAPPAGVPNPYEIDFAHSSVAMVIGDNDPVTTRLEITAPLQDQHFEAGETIELRAQIIGPGSGETWIVEFLDGNQRIGTTSPGGAIWWSDAVGGPHTINARAFRPTLIPAPGGTLVAEPVTISVGPGPAWPVVSIGVLGRGKTLEPCPVCFSPTAAFVISRTGPATGALVVYLEYDGPAAQGKDYRDMPHQVTIPAGQKSVDLILPALDDLLVEGPEIVRATIVSPETATLGYVVSHFSARAMVVIDDDEAGSPDIRLDIVEPEAGAQFAAGSTIAVSALGVWREGEVDRPVKFFAGNTFIGQSNPPQLERPTIPCLPSVHTIHWTNPPPGDHVLTARFERAPDVIVTSPPVAITVKDDHPAIGNVRISVEDDMATEISILTVIDVARFRVSRNGDLTQDLTVFYSAHGSATHGTDYRELSGSIRIPAGAASADLIVSPIHDTVPEGMETLLIRLEPSPMAGPMPTYEIDPAADDSVAVVLDGPGEGEPDIEIVWPENGARFPLPARIEIIAAAYHPRRDILSVDFFAGDTRIGESAFVFDRTVTGGLIVHRFTWNEPPQGAHALTALGYDEERTLVATSPAVNITVGSGTPLPVVRIEATSRIAEESSEPFRRMPFRGEFTISRTGPTTDPLSMWLHVSGSATSGADYPAVPMGLTIPAGAASTKFEIVPENDLVAEGIETVVVMPSHCPPETDPPIGAPCVLNFEVDPAAERATVFIRDDGLTEASLAITNPNDGTNFPVGATILIEATAIDLEGYISRVEFWDGGTKIGESEIVFIQAPPPGTPIYHSFEWRDAAPGPHSLTARTVNADGTALNSQPVHITVGPAVDSVVLDVIATDPLAAETGKGGAADPAEFTVRRIAGPRNISVPVYYVMDGTAQNGGDYTELSGSVLLPAGAESVRVIVSPIPDFAIEGDETVVIRLEPPVCIAIFPPPPECYKIRAHGTAQAVIQDGKKNLSPVGAITSPASGAEFPPDLPVEFVVETRDPDGYVRKVEFFAGGRKIGETSIDFIREPDPGEPQRFSFVWRQPVPGTHTIVARLTDDRGATTASAPIEIKVGRSEPLPIVIVAAPDPLAVEPRSDGTLNTATFRIRRFGPATGELRVAYSLRGTATNGIDYEMLPGVATIPAGLRSVRVFVRPAADSLIEDPEAVILHLEPPPPASPGSPAMGPYRIGSRDVAVAVIDDSHSQPSPAAAPCRLLAGDLLEVCFPAEDGQNFRIEATSDLRNWETLFDTVASDGMWHFIDSDAPNHRQRFYRMTPEPVAEVEE